MCFPDTGRDPSPMEEERHTIPHERGGQRVSFPPVTSVEPRPSVARTTAHENRFDGRGEAGAKNFYYSKGQ